MVRLRSLDIELLDTELLAITDKKTMGVDLSIQHWGTIDRGAEGAEVERRRRENRRAVGAEGCGVWGGQQNTKITLKLVLLLLPFLEHHHLPL